MAAEYLTTGCAAYAYEILRIGCGDIAAPSAELTAHLTACNACRAALADTSALLGALRPALAPQPMPKRASTRIQERLAAVPSRGQRRWAFPAALAYAALAAGLIATAALQLGLNPVSEATSRPAAVMRLSADDAATIAAAYTLLRWDDPAQYVTEVLANQTADVVDSIEHGTDAESSLPWSRADDWDVPQRPQGGASRAPMTRTQA